MHCYQYHDFYVFPERELGILLKYSDLIGSKSKKYSPIGATS